MKRTSNFDTRRSLKRRRAVTECGICHEKVRVDNLRKHMLSHNPMKKCKFCKVRVREDQLKRHEILCKDHVDERLCNRQGVEMLQTDIECSSVHGLFKSFKLGVVDAVDYDQIIHNTLEASKTLLTELIKKTPIKAQIVLALSFYRETPDEKLLAEKVFRSICEPLILGDNIDNFLGRANSYIREQIAVYERLGSGWLFDHFDKANLEVAKYCPLSGSGTVKIPNKIKKMRSVLNITSPDNRCFLYCLLAGLDKHKMPHKASRNKHPERYTSYKDRVDEINMGSVKFPVQISDIPKVEALNRISISVYEWCTDDDCVIPLKHRVLDNRLTCYT